MTVPPGTPTICPVMIGRAPALATLQQLIARCREGCGQTLLVSGEAGIGKSRLVREALSCAAAQDFRVLQGHCFQHDRTWPYAPLLDLLRAYFADRSPDDVATGPGREVACLLPELQPYTHVFEPVAALDPEQEKRRLFTALVTLVRQLAAEQPLLLIVEDLHWSDAASLDFLLYLARHLPPAALLLLTYRDDEGHPGLAWLAEFARSRLASEIHLSRLSHADVHAMLRAIFALQHPVRTEFLDALFALTEGNPFFVEEVLATLLAAGDIFYGDAGWDRRPMDRLQIPRSVQAAVHGRLERIGEDARQLLTVAGVVGRTVDAQLLQALTGLDEPRLLAGLKDLVRAHLMVEASPDQFTFRHALTQQAIYSSLLTRERTALHRACAVWLADRTRSTARIGDLAYHFYKAESWPEALAYGERAARHALARHAPAAALEHLDHTLEAAHERSVPRGPLLRLRAAAVELLGDFERARADLEQALAEARTTGDRRAICETLLDLGRLWASRNYDHAGSYFHEALDLTDTVDDLPLRAHSLNRVGNWHLNREQPDAARHYHSEALAIFQRLEDRRGLAETLDLLGMTNYLGGDLHAGTANYEAAVTLFRELDDRVGLINCLATLPMRGGTYQTNTLVAATSLLASHREGEEALALARSIGWRAGEAYALIFLGFCFGSRGEYGRACDVLHTALTIAEEIEHRQWVTAARCARGALYLDLFALGQARAELEAALVLARATGSSHWVHCAAGFLAVVYLHAGQPNRAEELVTSVLAPDAPSQTLGQRLAWCARAEVAVALGKAHQALTIVERLEVGAANRPQSGAPPMLRLLLLQGHARAALKQWEQAEVVFRAALALADMQGARPLLWQVQTALGTLLRQQDRHAEAETACAAARVVIEQLAADIPDAALRTAFLRRAVAHLPPTRTRSARRVTRHPVPPLTARECEVAAEVARGHSNAVIAAVLVLSERTVESHIGNILGKLGFRSRTAIAAWAKEAGLLHDKE